MYRKVLKGGAERVSQKECGQRCPDTGYEGSIIHNSDAGYFHCKKGRSHRSAEQGGKGGGNAAHENYLFILFVETERFAKLFPDAAAYLHRSALSAYGTAAEYSEHRRDKNKEAHAQRDMCFFMDAVDNGVGPGVIFIMERLI